VHGFQGVWVVEPSQAGCMTHPCAHTLTLFAQHTSLSSTPLDHPQQHHALPTLTSPQCYDTRKQQASLICSRHHSSTSLIFCTLIPCSDQMECSRSCHAVAARDSTHSFVTQVQQQANTADRHPLYVRLHSIMPSRATLEPPRPVSCTKPRLLPSIPGGVLKTSMAPL
jgi:hypothetical protein